MSRLPFAVLLVVALGCSKDPPPPVVQPPAGEQQKLDKFLSSVEKAQAEEEAIRKRVKTDLSPIIDRAKDSMRKAAERNFGTDAAAAATITADEFGVKHFGENAWEVTGHYDGRDEDDKPLSAKWTARIELFGGGLQTMNVSMDRE